MGLPSSRRWARASSSASRPPPSNGSIGRRVRRRGRPTPWRFRLPVCDRRGAFLRGVDFESLIDP
eukprot:9360326-Lingulodinium_polyedra.AAC.1